MVLSSRGTTSRFRPKRSEDTAENEESIEIIGILVQDALEASDPLFRLTPGDEHGPDKTGIWTVRIQGEGLMDVVLGLLPAVFLLLEAEIEILEMDIGHARIEKRVLPDDFEAVLEVSQRVFQSRFGPLQDLPPGFEIEFIGQGARDRAFGQAPGLLRSQLELQGVDDGAGDFLLNVEDIVQGAAVLLGPEVGVARRRR